MTLFVLAMLNTTAHADLPGTGGSSGGGGRGGGDEVVRIDDGKEEIDQGTCWTCSIEATYFGCAGIAAWQSIVFEAEAYSATECTQELLLQAESFYAEREFCIQEFVFGDDWSEFELSHSFIAGHMDATLDMSDDTYGWCDGSLPALPTER